MFHLFLIIISYASFLLLIIPATRLGTISAAVALVLGICVILRKQIYKTPFWKRKLYFLFPIIAHFAGFICYSFYWRRIDSSALTALGNLLHIPFSWMLLLCSLALAVLSVYIIYAALQPIYLHTSPLHTVLKGLISCIAASVSVVVSAQLMLALPVFSMGYGNFFWGVLIVTTVILFLYCLTRRILPSIFCGASFFMVVSTINVYIYRFRGRQFDPVDIFSARTAMNVAENYSLFPIPTELLLCWCYFIFMMAVIYRIHHHAPATTNHRYVYMYVCISIIFCIISSVTIAPYAYNLKTYHWKLQGASRNGYILDFTAKLKEITVLKPEQYSTESIEELAGEYTEESDAALSTPPHIIVIMDETFADLSVLGKYPPTRK